jgi:hypothetical protein
MQNNCNFILGNEADVVCRYLTGKPATGATRELYSRAFDFKDLNLSGREDRVWAKMIKFPFLLPFIDAGLAGSKPGSVIRKRIFVMLAIAETQPEYAGSFIGPERGILPFACFFAAGIKAIFYTVCGSILVRTLYRV